jgi:hypothetical protein
MKTRLKRANKTPLMSEVTINNKLKLGMFQKGGTIMFFPKLA